MLYASGLQRQKIQKLWTSDATFGTSLLALVLDAYGTEALSWDPETMRDTLNDDVGVTIPRASFDRCMAMVTVLTTNTFQASIPACHNICNALNGAAINPNVFDPVDAMELTWAVTEVTLNDTVEPRKLAQQYSEDVKAYMGVILASEGLLQVPKGLHMAVLPATSADASFADDPQMYQTVWALSQSKVADIDADVATRVAQLKRQLAELPISRPKG